MSVRVIAFELLKPNHWLLTKLFAHYSVPGDAFHIAVRASPRTSCRMLSLSLSRNRPLCTVQRCPALSRMALCVSVRRA